MAMGAPPVGRDRLRRSSLPRILTWSMVGTPHPPCVVPPRPPVHLDRSGTPSSGKRTLLEVPATHASRPPLRAARSYLVPELPSHSQLLRRSDVVPSSQVTGS